MTTTFSIRSRIRTASAAVAVAALAAATLTSCAAVVPGPITSEQREIDAVTSVVLDGAGELTITEGEPSLVVHAGSNVIDRLTSDSSGGELTLGMRGGFFSIGPTEVRYELTLPSLDSLRLDGAGDVSIALPSSDLEVHVDGAGRVDVDDIDASSVSVSIDGAGEVTLAGAANRLDVTIDGAGDVDAERLEARDASVDLVGAGQVTVHAIDALDARLDGVGEVLYFGDPTVTREVDGLGQVIPA